eukprot:TRINITY_DN1163_c0_g1_i3.p1 TRINITY_DN1163_c0_g1~~TRINITY_DN1163_c0_g1_i3.p1  ORF type:complete len:251 (-),score=80.87 TRINITY_DN1163_c0_g1_i3:253-1005(-)
MGLLLLTLALCLGDQGLASPLHAVFLPYLQQPVGYPWMGNRVPVVREFVPMVEPVVVELETQFTCTASGTFADPETCNKYYVCNEMADGELKGFIFACAPGLAFDAELGQCNWPTGEDCKHQAPVESCSGLEGDARKLCQERFTPQVQPVVIELETDLECTASGTFADPNSCNKYYSCVEFDGEFESYTFDCPPGLLFNALEKECDWAASVDCSIQESMEIDVCSGPELSEQQRTLCQGNAWKHTDHFRK